MSILASLLVALAMAEPTGSVPVGATLDVPYLSQTEALCGGAAVAMVFRYWGDRRADVQQFTPLVDRRAGGIAEDVLADAVRQRGWQARRLTASVDLVRERLAAGQPLILLLEDRPGRYHYVVAVGAGPEYIVVHDPSWGPSRRLTTERLMQAWTRSNFRALLVLPPASSGAQPGERKVESAGPAGDPPLVGLGPIHTQCERLLSEAVDEVTARGLAAANEIFGSVRRQCPDAAGPLGELAGVRFAERRWREAADLAKEAVDRDPAYDYAWDVLGSSRFMDDDSYGALQAWNHIGKPRLDSVVVRGLARTRYALVAQRLGLSPNTLLTADQYRLTERRLLQLPTRVSGRIGVRPEADGFATVEADIAERAARPRGGAEWTAAGLRTIVDREVGARLPGWTGQGEAWDVSWRWWAGRPRVAMSFAAPRVGRFGGIWRAEGFWESQSYATPTAGTVSERRLHGGVAVTDWISGQLRYELAAGLDSWDSRRLLSVGGTLERRFLDDRLAVSGSGFAWAPLAAARSFRSASGNATFTSSTDARGFRHLARIGVESVTRAAPLALWPGAGDGHARPMLLRAHPMLHGGVIEGPAFGRRLVLLNIESQRWLERPALPRLGVAVFADAARAAQRLNQAAGDALQVDAGFGLRLQLPGREGTLRIDYARGLRDGASQLTAGWQP